MSHKPKVAEHGTGSRSGRQDGVARTDDTGPETQPPPDMAGPGGTGEVTAPGVDVAVALAGKQAAKRVDDPRASIGASEKNTSITPGDTPYGEGHLTSLGQVMSVLIHTKHEAYPVTVPLPSGSARIHPAPSGSRQSITAAGGRRIELMTSPLSGRSRNGPPLVPDAGIVASMNELNDRQWTASKQQIGQMGRNQAMQYVAEQAGNGLGTNHTLPLARLFLLIMFPDEMLNYLTALAPTPFQLTVPDMDSAMSDEQWGELLDELEARALARRATNVNRGDEGNGVWADCPASAVSWSRPRPNQRPQAIQEYLNTAAGSHRSLSLDGTSSPILVGPTAAAMNPRSLWVFLAVLSTMGEGTRAFVADRFQVPVRPIAQEVRASALEVIQLLSFLPREQFLAGAICGLSCVSGLLATDTIAKESEPDPSKRTVDLIRVNPFRCILNNGLMVPLRKLDRKSQFERGDALSVRAGHPSVGVVWFGTEGHFRRDSPGLDFATRLADTLCHDPDQQHLVGMYIALSHYIDVRLAYAYHYNGAEAWFGLITSEATIDQHTNMRRVLTHDGSLADDCGFLIETGSLPSVLINLPGVAPVERLDLCFQHRYGVASPLYDPEFGGGIHISATNTTQVPLPRDEAGFFTFYLYPGISYTAYVRGLPMPLSIGSNYEVSDDYRIVNYPMAKHTRAMLPLQSGLQIREIDTSTHIINDLTRPVVTIHPHERTQLVRHQHFTKSLAARFRA